MDMCDNCADRQKWLLDNNDGSHIICTCQNENSQREDMQYDGEVATTTDVVTHTTPLRGSSPFIIPNAPKRKLARYNSRVWRNEGSYIRRHFFDFQQSQIMVDPKHKNWAILKIDTIITSKNHHCIRRFYIGNKNGVSYLEMEFYPCVKHAYLSEEYKNSLYQERDCGHKL